MYNARILLLEDNSVDRQLMEEMLKNNGSAYQILHAETKEEFQSALETKKFDLVLSDFSLPFFSGIAALALVKQVRPETPFIFVSGTIGEERAVECLKLGATDYVLKDRLGRLGQAVERALREARERREQEQERALRERLEAQLHQAQKMEAIGQLAAGLAHDFNNLLLIIRGNTELALQNGGQLQNRNAEHLKRVIAAADRATNLVRQLLTFSRKQVIQFQQLDLNQVISHLARMADRIVGEKVSLRCVYAGDLPPVNADAGMMEQVLVNLIVNARDAMPGGGSIFVCTERTGIEQRYLEAHPEGRVGEFACITVRDTGTGIAPELLPRIFEPFFTTKEIGSGTGLGLSAVYGIVKQHRGWVEVFSEPGEGTMFKIFLPAHRSDHETASIPRPPQPARGGHERVLLVEDDPDIRRYLKWVLARWGYQVQTAENGDKALDLWRTAATNFDLLLTDMIMPGGLNGLELAGRLRKERPNLKVIHMSGYHPEVAGKSQVPGRFLQKPFSAETLNRAMRDCLDENSAPK